MSINVIASGIFFCKLFTFAFSVLDFLILTTSLAITSLIFLYSETVFNLPTSKSYTFGFELFKPIETLTSLLMSN